MVCPDELRGPLYHGSAVGVDRVDLSIGAGGKDFGRGFYTTTSKTQAEKFALIKGKREGARRGFVSVFQYVHDPAVTIKKFAGADDEWLLFVLKNRGFLKRGEPGFEGPFDLVIGPVANDAVGLVLNQLLVGTYGDPGSGAARNTAIRLLETTKLYDQVFFGTPQGVSCLEFREALEIGIN